LINKEICILNIMRERLVQTAHYRKARAACAIRGVARNVGARRNA
jgi:hypothetical protein